MSANEWHIVSGEFPPRPGGVSDYTQLLAQGLADAGCDVHVWTGPAGGAAPHTTQPQPTVHRSAGTWAPNDLRRLSAELDGFAPTRRLLVQYVPNAWGYKGLNRWFCSWLLERAAAGDHISLMVHEPFYPWRLIDKPTRWLLAAGQRRMMRTLLRASAKVYISIPKWEPLLRPYAGGRKLEMEWLPIFSTVPVVDDRVAVSALRAKLFADTRGVVGSFGTFGGPVGNTTARVLMQVLSSDKACRVLLLGRGSLELAQRMCARNGELSARIIARADLSAHDVSLHLQVCDVLVQPYPDGISSRRTSAMAGLAHGNALVSNAGVLSEAIWADTGCVELAGAEDLAAHTLALLQDEDARRLLGACASATYAREFALARTVERLLQ